VGADGSVEELVRNALRVLTTLRAN